MLVLQKSYKSILCFSVFLLQQIIKSQNLRSSRWAFSDQHQKIQKMIIYSVISVYVSSCL